MHLFESDLTVGSTPISLDSLSYPSAELVADVITLAIIQFDPHLREPLYWPITTGQIANQLMHEIISERSFSAAHCCWTNLNSKQLFNCLLPRSVFPINCMPAPATTRAAQSESPIITPWSMVWWMAGLLVFNDTSGSNYTNRTHCNQNKSCLSLSANFTLWPDGIEETISSNQARSPTPSNSPAAKFIHQCNEWRLSGPAVRSPAVGLLIDKLCNRSWLAVHSLVIAILVTPHFRSMAVPNREFICHTRTEYQRRSGCTFFDNVISWPFKGDYYELLPIIQ